MAAGQEIDARFISILPSFSGFGKKVDQEFSGQAKRAGQQFGKAFGQGANASAKSIEDLQRRQSKAVEQATNDIRKARRDQEAAARKVVIEEKKLEEVRAKGNAKASQVLAAEDRLANAKRKHSEATGKVTAATTKSAQTLKRNDAELRKAKEGADNAGKSFQGFGKSVKQASDEAGKPGLFRKAGEQAEKAGKESGGRFSGALQAGTKKGMGRIGKLIKGGLVAGIGAAVGAATLTIQKGFARLSSIETAQKQLEGLKYSATDAAKIIKGPVLDAVKGTAYGLDEAASAAAGALGAGVKQGKELTRYLKLVGDATAQSTTDFSSMALMMNKVQGSGKLTGDVMQQMAQNGLQVMPMLVKALGKPQAEIQKMVSEGKISAEEFQKILEENIGGAAAKTGETTTGAFKNMGAAMGRVGASLLSGLFPSFGKGFNKLTGWLDKITPKAEEFGARASKGLNRVAKGATALYNLVVKGDFTKTFRKVFGVEEDAPIVGFLLGIRQTVIDLVPVVQAFGQRLVTGFQAAQPTLQKVGGTLFSLGQSLVSVLLPILKTVGQVLVTTVWPAIQKFGAALGRLASVVFPIVAQVVGTVIGAIKANLPTILPIVRNLGAIFSETFGVISAVVTKVAKVISVVWKAVGPTVLTVLRIIVKYVFTALGGLVQIIRGLLGVIVGLFKGDFTKVKDSARMIFSGLKQIVGGLIKATVDTLKAVFGSAVKWLTDKMRSLISFLSSSFKVGMAKAKDFILAPFRAARDGISGILDKLKSHMSTAVDSITGIWDKIKSAAKAPVKFVVETVINDGLLGAFRTIANKVGLSKLAEGMKVALPKGFARGGILPGTSSWRGGDTHLRPMREGEGVYVSEAMRDPLERARLHAVNAAAMAGRSLDSVRSRFGEGFAKGGVVQPVPGRGNRHTSGYPWATWAGDFPNPTGTPIKAWKDGVIAAIRSLTTSYGKHVRMNHTDGSSSLYAHMSRFASIVVGQAVKAGQTIGFVGSTGNSTGPHLHAEFMKGAFKQDALGSDGSSGFDVLGSLKAKFEGPLNKLKEMGGDALSQIAGKIPGKVVETLTEKAKGFAGEVVGAVKGAAGTARWTKTASEALMRTGDLNPLNLASLLRRMNQESGGNAKAINNWDSNASAGTPSKGLMQVIDPTFRAYRDHGLPNDIWDPLANIVASIRYAKSRYGSLRKAYDRPGGYADGTTNASPGLAWVGEQGPELLAFRGGETVIPNRQSMQIAGLQNMMAGPGRDLVDGFLLGVKGRTSLLDRAGHEMGATVTKAAKDELEIASPSKVFVRVGRWVNEGLVKGLRGTTAQVAQAMKTLRTNMESAWTDRNAQKKSSLVTRWQNEVKRLRPLVGSTKQLASRLKSAEKKLASARANRPSAAAVEEARQRVLRARKSGKGVASAEAALRTARSKRALPAQLEAEVKALRKAAKSQPKYAKKLAAAEAELAAARKRNTYDGVAAQWARFNKKIATTTKKLQQNATARAKAAETLKAAQDRLKEATSARNDFAESTRQSVIDSGSVIGKGLTTAKIVANLGARLKQWTAFRADLAQLRKLGLGGQAYGEILAAGPAEGGPIAKALIGDVKSIKTVNTLQKQIADMGTGLGKEAANMLYQPGVDSAQGYIKGVQSQIKNLEKAGTKLAKALQKSVKKALKIKSPSRVMAALGEFTGEGLVVGMDSTTRAVQAAGNRLAEAAVPGAMSSASPAAHAAVLDGARLLLDSGALRLVGSEAFIEDGVARVFYDAGLARSN